MRKSLSSGTKNTSMGKCLPLAGRYVNGEVFAISRKIRHRGSVCHYQEDTPMGKYLPSCRKLVNGEVFAIWQ